MPTVRTASGLYFKREFALEENPGRALHDPALIGYEELIEVAAEE